MKPFAKYLAESERTYNYRIKVVGDVPDGFFKELRDKCAQFDIVKMSDAKSTPVRRVIPDFPAFPNQPMKIVDVEFKYPAIEPQIKQLAQILGLDPNRIVMMATPYEESMDVENRKIEDQNKDLLDSSIIYDRDFKYDYFGFKTLTRSYLMKLNGEIAERPQQM